VVAIVRWLPPSLGSRRFPGTIPCSRAVLLTIHRTHIFRINHHLILIEIVEGLFEIVKQIHTLFRLHYHVINISFDISPNLRLQNDVNALLICRSLVLQHECHLGVTEDPKWCDERCFFFIINGKANLMIVQIGIQKRQ
jgi:hypothetical protein